MALTSTGASAVQPEGLLPRCLVQRPGALNDLAACIPEDVRGIALVADRRVMDLYGETVMVSVGNDFGDIHPIAFAPGEASKTPQTLQQICSAMLRAGLDRHSLVLALGGGVSTDLGGFAAAIYMRGIRLVNLPTTLVGVVDAAIGGKTAVNLPGAKNALGCWLRPCAVVIDTDALATLPAEELLNGMGELLKAAIVGDAELFAMIEANAASLEAGRLPGGDLLARALAVKTGIVGADPFERGRRAWLNFGHSVAHALEAHSGFGLSHGEAVATGMAVEARIARALGLLSAGDATRILNLLADLGFATVPACRADEALPVLWRDKKNSGATIRMALPVAIGQMFGDDNQATVAVEESLLREAWHG